MRKPELLIAVAALLAGAVVSAVQLHAQAAPTPAAPAAPAAGGRGGRGGGRGAFQDPQAGLANLALVATPTTSFVSGNETLEAVNDGLFPNPQAHYGNWPRGGTQWVQYTWPKPISTNHMDVYWWQDGAGIHLPVASRLKYWNGTAFVDVPNAKGLGVAGNQFNETEFDEITTDKIRLEFDADTGNQISTGIIEFRVFDSGKSPAMPPQVAAGIDRIVVQKGKTYLTGTVKQARAAGTTLAWTKESGPGPVEFADAHSAVTTATFNELGDYVLKLSSSVGELSSSSTLKVRVEPASSGERLNPVQTSTYSVDSPLWTPRLKVQITTWIPHVVDFLEHPEKHARQGPGGLDNFIEAGKRLRGEPAARHLGYAFANAYTYNTLEAMCEAQMYDARGDQEILKAQAELRTTIDKWIPIILAAQEPDGYIQTRFTLNGGNHWSPQTRAEHEGYVMGYFLESAIAHYNMTGGKDKTLYNAAKKCADCWVANIGPGKKVWYDGHQEMENALVRFSRLVESVDGPGKGKPYVELAKFLLDSRAGGSSYDQSHLPVVKQYEALGHAVRAAYTYTGMASVAAEFHDLDYESATKSLWDNIMNKKIYITGGIGSGDTSEGFGPSYSLSNNAYAESCANCGDLFFQYNMLLNYHDAKFVNAYEDTLYNAILGDNNLAGTLFQYTNPLVNGARTTWHDCPCCVGNIPRTMLQLPTWSYSTGTNDIYTNLYIGGTMTVHNFKGTDVQMVQKTNYPWDGKVEMTVNPALAKNFTVRLRIPDHQISTLYLNAPVVAPTLKALTVNGTPVSFKVEGGYALVTRDWKAGDKIAFEIPLEAQRVKANENVAATRGRVALRYGPLIYNVETVDGNNMNAVLPADAPLTTQWMPDMLEGVMVIKSKYAGGTDLVAIPNYARNNRQQGGAGGGRGGGAFSQVWIRDQ